MVVDSAPSSISRDVATVVDREPAIRRRGRWLHGVSLVVLIAGLAVTAGLCIASHLSYLHSERRQVSAQTQLAADSLAVAPIDIQRRLGRATTLVSATGNLSLFSQALTDSLPTPFAGVRLLHVVANSSELVDSLGEPTLLDPDSSQAAQLARQAVSSGGLVLTRLTTASAQRFGYAVAASTGGQTYVAYAEQVLPGNRRATLPAASPLADMDFALYYGKTESAATLIETNAGHLPLGGTTARATIPFGSGVLSAVVSPRSPLLGRFAASIAWLIAIAGTILTAVMVLLTERLLRRRAVAEQLASVTSQLYQSQRSVAETLQQSLLPQRLPRQPDLEVATRYQAGTEGIDVGGDWYDLITLTGDAANPRIGDRPDGERVFFTIGDVSGRGLSAATMMSRLRHTITAYALEGHDPATVLSKVSASIDLDRDRHFATVACGILDLTTGTVTIANAGHPPPLVVTTTTAEALHAQVGPPLGVGRHYTNTETTLPPGAVLLAYTDGLVERRGETITTSIARLTRAARADGRLEDLLDTVLATLIPHGSDDDTALLGLRWTP
jgi:serine phosphatase RsbU (regulator of sigma subunit)